MWCGLLLFYFVFNHNVVSFTAATRGPMFIKEPPDEVDFSNVTGIQIHCEAQGIPTPNITWIRSEGGGKIDEVPGLRITHPNGTLHFLPFRAETYRQDIHASVYRCVASNPLGTVVSRDVRVRAVVKQNYEANVYDEFVILHNTAVIKCHIPSFVQDYVIVTAWIREDEKGSQSVINNGGRFSVFPSGVLHIRDVSKQDVYRYKCETKHILTHFTKMSATSGSLIVSDPQSSVPTRLSHHIPEMKVLQGTNVEMPCAAQGRPNPQYTWWKIKNGRRDLLKLGGRFEQRSGSLFIHRVQIDDEITFICEANNSLSVVRAETILTVTAPLMAFIQPSYQQIDVGKGANLTCTPSGYPITSIEWLKDGSRLLSSGRVRLISPEVLRINSVQREDRGIYQCFVKNKVHSAQASAELKLGDAIPVFHETFPAKVYQKGVTVLLTCIIYGNPPPQVSWTVDDLPLPETSRYHIQQLITIQNDVISYVNISSLNTEDGGEYSCIGKNRVGKTSYSARIDVHGPPFIRFMPNITAITGESMTIKCRASGYPIHQVSWERDGNHLPINHRQKIFPNGTLEVDNLERPTDEGPYTCIVARNHHGESARRTVYVSLISAPTITPFSFPHNLREGMRAGITCFITDGDLPITIKWLKDGEAIASHMDVSTNTLNEFTSTLAINSIKPRNNGNYTCVAKNKAAVTNYTAQLLVNVPPRWLVEPRDSNVTQDKSVVLDCRADGFPLPNTTWKRRMGNGLGDYRTIHYMDNGIFIADNGSLIISNAQEANEGYYLCQANNGVVSGLSKLAFLKVHIPPRFDTRRKTENVRKGSSAKLVCEVKGDSPLIMIWKKNDSAIDPHQDPRISVQETVLATRKKSELIIHKTERADHATFSCHSRNNYGSDTMTINLAVLEHPEAPRQIAIGRKSSRTVELSWRTPFDGNSAVTKYIYQYKFEKDTWSHNDPIGIVNGTSTSALVMGLSPAVSYNFRVAAENDVGIGNYSDDVAATTSDEAPGEAPMTVRVDAISSHALRVTWKPPRPELWNGEIQGYRIGYRHLESVSPYSYLTSDSSGPNAGNEAVLLSLKKFSKYGVIIEAYNRIGSGPQSEEVTAYTMEDTPSFPPQDLKCTATSSKVIRVKWTPPPQQYIHGILLGYKIFYHPVDISEETLEPKSSPSTTMHLEDLDPFTNYSIRVLAYTKAGDGVRSKAEYCKTEEDVPSAPADIKVLVMSSDAILVSWRPPNRHNGKITKYTVYMRGGTLERPMDHSLPPRELLFEARSLKEDFQYEFWVTASTVMGEGKQSRRVFLSPHSTVPAKIGSFAESIIVYRKTDVRLPCRAVGIPTPEREWKLRGQSLRATNRIRILPDGSLDIRNGMSSDSGNYTCRVENIYAVDEITHDLIVKVKEEKAVPPSSPIIKVSNIGKTFFSLSWKVEDDGGSPMKSYTLNHKSDSENSAWQQQILESENTSYVLKNLYCGSRYHVFMTATNQEGSSIASNMETIHTKGIAPIVPSQESLLILNRTFVNINLEAWAEGGCPIKTFIIECKQKGNFGWTLIANDVIPEQKQYTIRDLVTNTSYTIRVSAISDAEVKRAEYEVVTLDDHKGIYAPDFVAEGSIKYIPFYFNLNVIIPTAVALIVIIVVTATVCDFMRRRQYRYPTRKSVLSSFKDSKSRNIEDKPTNANQEGAQNYSSANRPHSPGPQDDVSPYATYQLPECISQEDDTLPMKTFGQQLGTPTSAQPQATISANSKGLYSKVRKIRSSGINERQRYPSLPVETHPSFEDSRGYPGKHKGPPPREILRMHPFIESAVPVAPSAPPAEYESTLIERPITPESNSCTLKYDQNARTKPFHRVPDLLYHRPDSSTSNETASPDMERGGTFTEEKHRNRQHRRNNDFSPKRSESRGSSPDSPHEVTNFTYNKATLGPPDEFTDNKEMMEAKAVSNSENVCITEETAKDIDPGRLAAAEEELIALLKRGTSSSSTGYFRSSKEDFIVRV